MIDTAKESMEKAFFSLSIPEVKGLVEFSETAAHFPSEYNGMKLASSVWEDSKEHNTAVSSNSQVTRKATPFGTYDEPVDILFT